MSSKNVFTSEDLQGQAGSSGSVTVTFDGDVAIIRMLCGENRLNVDFITKLHTALDEVERNENAKVLITTSDGKIYSNGLDLDWMSKLMNDQHKLSVFNFDILRGAFKRMATFPLPTIAALNGHAFAGGFMFTLCHDYVVMSSTRGWICLNEVHLGMLFGQFMKNIILSKLPSGIAMHEAVVLGKRFTAEEALSKGIVQKICPREELLETAKTLGRSLTKRSAYDRNSLQNMKEDLYSWCFDVEPKSKL